MIGSADGLFSAHGPVRGYDDRLWGQAVRRRGHERVDKGLERSALAGCCRPRRHRGAHRRRHGCDGTTPTGLYRFGLTAYGNDPNPGYRGPYHRLVCGDWWDEDPTSHQYNTFQHVPCGHQPPLGGDSEAPWTERAPYPSFVVVDYNTGPVVPYAGSAIFVHADIGAPTAGCVSIPLGDLDKFLRWLNPGREPAIAHGAR